MLAILISWITIFFVLFSLGDIFICIYNKLCNRKEQYNTLDTFILGVCFVLIPLQLTSLWLPSNHYMLLVYIVISIAYWCYNRRKLKEYIYHVKNNFNLLSLFQKLMIVISLSSIIIFLLFLSDFFDSDFYHYQNIRWNEEYAVVPGLGNLEDRFGFNSNYLLLSAIFSFRFLFGEAVCMTQGLLYIMLLCWGFWELIKSEYNINRIFLLIFLVMIFLMGNTLLDNSSTDIIPILCVFYYIAKTVLSSNWLSKQPLLAFILPISLITFKLSTVIFCLMCLIVIIQIIKKKNYRMLIFLITTAFLIIAPWCIRNVILTGYLVYPIYEIDLFSFDWKMPLISPILQRAHIHDYACFIFSKQVNLDNFSLDSVSNKFQVIVGILNSLFYILVLTSPITIVYSILKKRKIPTSIYCIYLVSTICIIFNLLTAPDLRFMYGYIWGCAFIHTSIIPFPACRYLSLSKMRNFILFAIALSICYITYKNRLLIISYNISEKNKEIFTSIIKKPAPHPRSYESKKEFDIYKMGKIEIFITLEKNGRTFDQLPGTNPTGLPFSPFDGNKIQSIKTVENRGERLQDGFRSKKEYYNVLNENVEKYKDEYQKIFNKNYYGK